MHPNLLILFLVFASIIWVYLDITKHKIGRVSNKNYSFNWSVWEWVIAVSILWIVFFPAYLYKRTDLMERSKDYPVEYKRRAFGLFMITAAGIALIALLSP